MGKYSESNIEEIFDHAWCEQKLHQINKSHYPIGLEELVTELLVITREELNIFKWYMI
jgi:hypothetical protein